MKCHRIFLTSSNCIRNFKSSKLLLLWSPSPFYKLTQPYIGHNLLLCLSSHNNSCVPQAYKVALPHELGTSCLALLSLFIISISLQHSDFILRIRCIWLSTGFCYRVFCPPLALPAPEQAMLAVALFAPWPLPDSLLFHTILPLRQQQYCCRHKAVPS